jgi:hypothetical protein
MEMGRSTVRRVVRMCVDGMGTKRRGCEDPDRKGDCTRGASIGVFEAKSAS